ncbi:Transcription factor GTE10 [Porphyridium purpureum]|uniref:Transcription factor GTE10 n=1 Tax=Porphyridium purpureum TaxID=35688 RepID=A0A5J4Z2H8_PORPP|nr:Transcription factor GTE10 [Porphyridium purpureum]|eukprot:POR1729..scf208_2
MNANLNSARSLPAQRLLPSACYYSQTRIPLRRHHHFCLRVKPKNITHLPNESECWPHERRDWRNMASASKSLSRRASTGPGSYGAQSSEAYVNGTLVEEKDIRDELSVSTDESGVPTRELVEFRVLKDGHQVPIDALDDASVEDKAQLRIMAVGTAVNGTRYCHALVGPLLEWCIEYGLNPALYVRTELAWYKLGAAAKDYTKTYTLTRRRFEICARAFILATSMDPREASYANFLSLLSHPYMDMKGYTERDILKEASFILDQAGSLDDPSLLTSGFCTELAAITQRGGDAVALPGADLSAKGSFVPANAVSHNVSSQVSGTRNAGVIDEQDTKACAKLLASLEHSKNAWPFLQPVDPSLRDYFLVVQHPMDLATVRSKLDTGQYADVAAFAADVQLIWSNCKLYNADGSELFKMAVAMEKKFAGLLRSAGHAPSKSDLARVHSKTGDESVYELAPPMVDSGGKPPTGKLARRTSSGGSPGVHTGHPKVDDDKEPQKSQQTTGITIKVHDSSAPAAKRAKREDRASEPLAAEPCARRTCPNFANDPSKYCGETCGIAVASQRLELIFKAVGKEQAPAYIWQILAKKEMKPKPTPGAPEPGPNASAPAATAGADTVP